MLKNSFTMKYLFALFSFLLFVLPGSHASADELSPGATAKAPTKITIISSGSISSQRTFTVVLYCDTDELRAQGLQGFRPLTADEAALFIYRIPEAATFWMGSVAFPIDIIFVGPDGRVARVYRHCMPGSRKLYPSGEKIKWVVETAAGSAIQVGDRVLIHNNMSGRGLTREKRIQ